MSVVVVVVVAVVVIIVIVMITVILMVPVSFVHLPSTLVVIVVGVAPVSAWVWRSVPAPRNPSVAIADDSPVTVYPHETVARHRRADFITNRRGRSSNIDLDLAPRGCCNN
jgi:hypothetical protein